MLLWQVAKSGEGFLAPGNQPSSTSTVLTVFETFASNNTRKQTLRSLAEVYQVATINPWSDTCWVGNNTSQPPKIFLERLFKPSVLWEGEQGSYKPEKTAPTGDSADNITPSAHVIMEVIAAWIEPFLAYLLRQELPKDQNEARCIVRQSKAYKVHEGELYKKSTSGVLQMCISEEEW